MFSLVTKFYLFQCDLVTEEKCHDIPTANVRKMLSNPTAQEELEECLRRVNVVKGHELEEINTPQLECERDGDWHSNPANGPSIIKTPNIQGNETLRPPADTCDEHFQTAICCRKVDEDDNPHKIVRFQSEN